MSQDGAQGRYAGGSVAGGRYQLRDLLGEGGMASVYLAYDSALDRQVAIKTLHTELGREQSFRERFRREAQAVAKLSHTNIVSVFDTGEDTLDGAVMPYIVMEYVEGQPLGSVLAADIRQYGAMPADKALKVTADVLAALEVSHEMGLVHRDIKPGNVMTTKRGVVKVMDFGIARAMQSGVTSMTQTGMVVGTPQYLSPEQALGRAVDARSDLYSVGIMLFQLLTGRLPFDADSPLAIAYAHVQEEPVAPSTVNRSVTPAMDALVARALRKNPNERFPSAAVMRDECLRVLSAGQTGAPMIVQGGPVSSGSGVGSAVFPPVGQTPPPTPQPGPHGVQQPYLPPTPQPGPYGPATPAPGPAYGYPLGAPPGPQGPGGQAPAPAPMYQTPAPAPSPYAPGPMHTPAPMPTPAPVARGGGSRRNTPVLVGAVVAALLAVGGLIFVLNKDNEADPNAGGTGGTETEQSQTVTPGHKGPDLTKTIDMKKCTQPSESSDDPSKFEVPNFTYKNIQSVKACVQAAGWKIMTQTPVDESTYGEGTVLEQYPPAGEDITDEDAEFTLKISTGNPPQ
ncbi:Serine or threonine protein kinase [Streptomyces venezuelae]|uniref:protein kinase domain-containing protein n=1 Tax=Streptomyces gardneri TaxID=66892 RepID=UPI0006BD8E1F|nr:protein kinase [Streptomyces gardneri]ALO09603.1 Serine or threonine protein kinase [Streptomyces venezuelae]QPK46690.1 serine/threonine protein kinase [Streptomyces gardneri]WRK38085.1 protein kinase [Streptomyces venezuelae]CUM39967.1 Serine/threonine protein kinase PrkC, regulator of stationary phase [Streptomyces venezuelae]